MWRFGWRDRRVWMTDSFGAFRKLFKTRKAGRFKTRKAGRRARRSYGC